MASTLLGLGATKLDDFDFEAFSGVKRAEGWQMEELERCKRMIWQKACDNGLDDAALRNATFAYAAKHLDLCFSRNHTMSPKMTLSGGVPRHTSDRGGLAIDEVDIAYWTIRDVNTSHLIKQLFVAVNAALATDASFTRILWRLEDLMEELGILEQGSCFVLVILRIHPRCYVYDCGRKQWRPVRVEGMTRNPHGYWEGRVKF